MDNIDGIGEYLFPDLIGSRVLIFGGAGSVGSTTAALARKCGADIVIVDQSRERVDSARAKLGNVETQIASVRNETEVKTVLDDARPHHIVLATGWPYFTTMKEIDIPATIDWVQDRLVPILAISKWLSNNPSTVHSFTIVSGFIPRKPEPKFAIWSMWAPGLVALVEALAVELGPTRVNAVGPGPMVDSPMVRENFQGKEYDRLIEQTKTTSPIRKVVKLIDTARQIMFLMGDPVATGNMRLVEGGTSLTFGLSRDQ